LTKFLKSVTWEDSSEVRLAVDMLPIWVEIDVDDALELLSPTFRNSSVQQHAVNQLKRADDEELMLYLLQLVQALKFGVGATNSPLCQFLVSRSLHDPILGNHFYWFIKVESKDKVHGPIYTRILGYFLNSLKQVGQDYLMRSFQIVKVDLKLSKDKSV
jgi:phosphatidylinositol 3-kinase